MSKIKQYEYSVLRELFPHLTSIYQNDFGGWDVVEITDQDYEQIHFYKFIKDKPEHTGTIVMCV